MVTLSPFFIKVLLIAISLTILIEVFIRFKLAHLYPTKKLSDNSTDIHTTATMPALAAYMTPNPKHMVNFLLDQQDIVFMLSRMAISPSEIHPIALNKELLFQKAADFAKVTHTTYIDTPHIFAAYLSLSEPSTKLLFQKKLKERDVLRIIVWTQLAYPARQERHTPFQIIGDGYGEALTTGWTYETQKYTLDWTTEALRNHPLMFGYTDIFEQIVGVLSQPHHNNVLLIGEAGSGKHMLIDKLAFESYNGLVPANLQHKRILALIASSLTAGTQAPQELQTRLQAVLSELAHAQVIIAFPNMQDILGDESLHMDLSGTLLPYLEHGSFPIIATTTVENYKHFIEQSSLKDMFTPITLPHPDEETLYGMLFLSVLMLEQKQQFHFSYLAVQKAIKLSNRFDPLAVLPGSAVKLLESTGTAMLLKGKNTVTGDDIAAYIQETTHISVMEPNQEEKDMLIHFEDIMHTKVIGQDDAIVGIAESMRRLRSGLTSTTKPISFLFLGPTGVGKTETAKTLADIYYHGQANMIRLNMSEYSGTDGLKRLLGASPGQGDETGEITEKVMDHPASLILLDEFEKANPAILDLFLQVLDDGRLTDNKGKTVSFTNCIIIATSNAGAEYIREHIDTAFHQELLNHLQSNHVFKPELLNRFDDVVVFKPLDQTQVMTITTMLLQSLITKMEAQDITISFDSAVIQKIATESYDPQLGARPIQRYIQDNIEDIIAKKKLDGTLTRGTHAVFVLNQAGSITIQAPLDSV